MNAIDHSAQEITCTWISTQLAELERDIAKGQYLLDTVAYECGRLGLSLFYGYYSLFTGNAFYLEQARHYCEQTLAELNLTNFKRVYSTDSLDNHLGNLGRFLCFVTEHQLIPVKSEQFLLKLDSILEQMMDSKIAAGDFDYNSGALASAYYFISRLATRPQVASCLAKLVKGLAEKAQQDADGDYYWSSPRLYHNVFLGLSHGSAMVVSILSTLAARAIETETCTRLLAKATQFILKHYREKCYSHFPTTTQDDNIGDKPFCICYGDLGVAYALLKANVLLKQDSVSSVVTQVLEESLHRKRMAFFPRDASITYGAAGLATFFLELQRLTADQRCAAAAKYWINEIPGYAVHGGEFSGFRSMTTLNYDLWNMSFGWGIIGISMALMKHAKPVLPTLTPLLMIA